MQPLPIELFALKKIFDAGDELSLSVLSQLEQAEVVEREMTGVGFFATIRLPIPLPTTPIKYREWQFAHKHLAYGGSLMCWFQDPCLLELEAVALVESWPEVFDADDFSTLS